MSKRITFNLFQRILCLVLIVFCFLTTAVELYAAPMPISGIVTDENNQPIAGVSIFEKADRAHGTSTDAEGKYNINVERGSTLVFSYIGYLSQEVVTGASDLNVKLSPQSNSLNEVVAIGYQTLRKSDVTGAISSVKSDELNISAPSLGQALVGKVAGVQISQVSGAPYQSTKVRVRGVGSFSASSDPLYVIDGYPAGNDLFLNPEDIESIDILKDAASASIYGSRASGGVVLITTKKGKEGKGKFEYDVQTGVNQLANKVKLMNSDEFAQLVIDGRNNSYRDLWENSGKTWNDAMYSDSNAKRIANVGNAGTVSIPYYLYDFVNQKAIPQTVNTDWQDELYRNAFFQRHTLSFSGGAPNVRYYLSGGYQNQDGIMLGSGQKRYNFRGNVDADLTPKLHVGINTGYTQNINRETQEGRFDHGPVLGALIYMPFFPAYNADGSLATNAAASQSSAFGFQSIENPVALATRTKINRAGYRTTINANASYRILPSLSLKVNLGQQTYSEKYDYYLPTSLSSGANPPGSAQAIAAATAAAQNTDIVDQLAEYTLNYDKKFGKHRLNAFAGYTAQQVTGDIVSVVARGFQNDNIPEITAKGADPAFFTLYSSNTAVAGTSITGLVPTQKYTYTLLSYLGRVNYVYNNKYFLTAAFRADGSSRFGPDNKYGYFPSLAGGWNLSDESFYNNWLGNQSTIKLRASGGFSGNYNIGNYNTVQTLANPTGVVFGNTSAIATATLGGPLRDNRLSWESTGNYNIGADIGLFKGRLSVIANYYQTNSSDILYEQPISAISGNRTILTNLNNSQIRNRGFDFQLDGRIINKHKFKFNASGNISINRNKVTKLSGDNTIIVNGAERSYPTHITIEGQPVGMFYGYKVAGVVTAQNISEVPRSSAQSNPLRVGDLYFEDVVKDGIINDKDKQVIGSPYADFTYGFTLNAFYGDLSLNASFNGSQGNDILDGQDYYLFNMEGSGNQYAEVTDRYRNTSQPGNGEIYRAARGGTQSNSTRLSSFYLQDGSFFRCNNISLSYSLNSLLRGKAGISNANVFASVVNAFTITKYKGYNPEVDYNLTGAASNGTQPSNLAPGVDYGSYPLVRSFNLGVRVAF